MRPDLMERFAAERAMPTYAQLMRTGVKGDNGLTQGFPPNTGVGWYTPAAGTWPGEHGLINNTFHVPATHSTGGPRSSRRASSRRTHSLTAMTPADDAPFERF